MPTKPAFSVWPLMLLLVSVCPGEIIDFTVSDPFSAAHMASTATFDHLGRTFTLSAQPTSARMTYNPGAGIGVTYGLLDEPDEIDFPEVLTINFTQPEYLTSFIVSNMRWQLFDYERGSYSIDGGQWITFTGAPSAEKVVTVGQRVQSIRFSAPIGVSDFTLRSLNVTSVPEDSAAALLVIVSCGALLALRKQPRCTS